MTNRDYLNNAEYAVSIAAKAGAHLAEAYISNSNQLELEVRKGQIETLKLAEEIGLGLRVIVGGRVGFAFTTDIGSNSIREVVEQALANAVNTASEKNRSLPEPVDKYPQLDIYDSGIKAIEVEEKISMVKMMEEEALAFDSRIKLIENASYQDGEVEVAICNSLGISLNYRGTYCGVYLSLVAGEGEKSHTGFALDYKLRYKDLDSSKVGKEAARRAVRILGAKPVSTQQVCVVLDPYVATGFLQLIAPSLTGEAVQKGRSLFANKKGQKVASNKINIVDDGTLAGGLASAPFDSEGYPTSNTDLIQNGIVEGFLHNTYTASKEGVPSTGNGIRYSFKGTPEVGITNFYIKKGNTPPQELIKDIKQGFYVTEVLGMHTANPISGDFSVGAAGLWIENGIFTNPVKGVALAGNIIDLLQNIEGVGNDLVFYGVKGSPTLRISRLSISGN